MKPIIDWIQAHGLIFAFSTALFLLSTIIIGCMLFNQAWQFRFQRDEVTKMYDSLNDLEVAHNRNLQNLFDRLLELELSNMQKMDLNQLLRYYREKYPDTYTDIAYGKTNILMDTNLSNPERSYRYAKASEILLRIESQARRLRSNSILEWAFQEDISNNFFDNDHIQLILKTEKKNYQLKDSILFQIGYSNAGFRPATVVSSSLAPGSRMINYHITRPDGQIIIPTLTLGGIVDYLDMPNILRPGETIFRTVNPSIIENIIFTIPGKYDIYASGNSITSKQITINVN